MTANSELFIDEVVRSKVIEVIGRAVEIDIPKDWQDIWGDNEFPNVGKSIIRDVDTNDVIGRVEWTVTFEIDDDNGIKYVKASLGNLIIVLEEKQKMT